VFAVSEPERRALRKPWAMDSVARMWLALILAAALPEAARAYSLLSYIAGDYPAAVDPGGALISRQELDEQALFASDAAQDLRSAGAEDLAAQAEHLRGRIAERVAPGEVVPLARALSASVSRRFKLEMLPGRAPDLRRGAALYRQACAACHGADGTPRVGHLELGTQPTAFSSRREVARLSPQRIFAAVSFGVPGTAMPSFSDALDEPARWDLAFSVLALAHPSAERRRGEELVRKLPRRPDWMQLAVRTDDQLRAALAGSPFSAEDREAVISAVRSAFADPDLTTAGATRGW
jgi:high-affinity iron transporter